MLPPDKEDAMSIKDVEVTHSEYVRCPKCKHRWNPFVIHTAAFDLAAMRKSRDMWRTRYDALKKQVDHFARRVG